MTTETYHRVQLQPQPQAIHLTAHAGPNDDLIMVNFYEKTRWLTFAEALELASALIRCAWDQDRKTLETIIAQNPDAAAWLRAANGS